MLQKNMLRNPASVALVLLFQASVSLSGTPVEPLEPVAQLEGSGTPSVDQFDRPITDQFGIAVAMEGDVAVIGAPLDDDEYGHSSGAAFVYYRDQGGTDQWGKVARLVGTSGPTQSKIFRFGRSVSISGDLLAVGAPDSTFDRGEVFLFQRDLGGADQWGELLQISTALAPGDLFGSAVALDGDTLLVGAPRAKTPALTGAVYVFERDHGGAGTWGEVAMLLPGFYNEGAFGGTLALSGTTALIGNGSTTYIFERDTDGLGQWGETARLISSDGEVSGTSAAIQGDIAVVGDGNYGIGGAVYVFERHQGGLNLWGQVAKLSPGIRGAGFGSRVAIDGSTIVANAPGLASDTVDGVIYAFERHRGGDNAWGAMTRLDFAGMPVGETRNSGKIALAETTVISGFLPNNGDDPGLAQAFKFAGPRLDLPALAAVSMEPVTVPLSLNTFDQALGSVAFSVDYDETCLTFDATDTDPADGIPDAVDILLPAGFGATVAHDAGDTAGELDFTLAALDPMTTTLPDGNLATLTLTPTCTPSTTASTLAPLTFGASPTFLDPDALAVSGAAFDGSIEIVAGIRGDCDGDGTVDAGDLFAIRQELIDGDGNGLTATLDAVPFLGSPVGCDANADGRVDAGDLSCFDLLMPGQICTAPSRGVIDPQGPRLSLPIFEELIDTDPTVVVTFEPRGQAVNSVVLTLDYLEEGLVFDDVPGAVDFLDPSLDVTAVNFDPSRTHGELTIVMAKLTPGETLAEGPLVEVDLRILEPYFAREPAVRFDESPTPSFGTPEGQSIPGTILLGTPLEPFFSSGFEMGTFFGWSSSEGGI